MEDLARSRDIAGVVVRSDGRFRADPTKGLFGCWS